MGFPQGLISYPGIKAIISADVVRGHGISPNPITLTIAPQREEPARTGTLSLSYGNFRLDIPGCIIDTVQYRYDQSGMIWQLVLLDERWKWQYFRKGTEGYGLTIDLTVNPRLPNGPIDRIDPAREYGLSVLFKECLQRLNTTSTLFVGQQIPDLKPELQFDRALPAQALQILCDTAGKRLVYRFDRRIAVVSPGLTLDGRPGDLPNGPVVFDNFGANPPESPDEIHLVCGPTRYQGDFYCEPVGDDVDGLIVPIDELTYKPSGGWEYGDLLHFMDVPLFTGNVSEWRNYVRPRELAKASVYRKYRIALKPRSFQIPGYKDAKKIKDTREILPIGQEIIEPTFDKKTGWYRPIDSIVWGVFAYGYQNNTGTDQAFDNAGNALPDWQIKTPIVVPERDPVTGRELKENKTTVISKEDYEIDNDTGIITFRQPMYRYGEKDSATGKRPRLPAIIWLRCGVCVNDSKTFTPKRHIEKIALVAQAKTNGGIMEVRDESLFARYVPKYSNGRPDAITGATDNLKLVKKEAEIRLKAEARKFQDLRPKLRTYAGWDSYDLDGAIHQICYHLSNKGEATMTVCLNDELTVLTMPYNERRFYERMAYEKENMADLLKFIKDKNLPFSRLSGLSKRTR